MHSMIISGQKKPHTRQICILHCWSNPGTAKNIENFPNFSARYCSFKIYGEFIDLSFFLQCQKCWYDLHPPNLSSEIFYLVFYVPLPDFWWFPEKNGLHDTKIGRWHVAIFCQMITPPHAVILTQLWTFILLFRPVVFVSVRYTHTL